MSVCGRPNNAVCTQSKERESELHSGILSKRKEERIGESVTFPYESTAVTVDDEVEALDVRQTLRRERLNG